MTAQTRRAFVAVAVLLLVIGALLVAGESTYTRLELVLLYAGGAAGFASLW